MDDRLPTQVLATALMRRVHDAGGSAMVLAKGDATGGMMLFLLLTRGENPRFIERGIGSDGRVGLIASGPKDTEVPALTDYWQRRIARDPDLWVIELDVPDGERFVAETIVGG